MPINLHSNQVSIDRLSFPIARFRLRFFETASNKTTLSAFSNADFFGSAWRGAFGNALKRAVCITNLKICDDCSLLHSCPYPNLFEPRTPTNAQKLSLYPRTPVPYVLEPSNGHFDTQSATHNLGLVLLGNSIDKFPYVVSAFRLAGKQGLTAKRIQLDLHDVQIESFESGDLGWETVYENNQYFDLSNFLCEWEPPYLPSQVRIRLISPLRLKFKGRLVSESRFTFRAFAASLLRRISLLTYFFSEKPLEIDFAEILQTAESIPLHSKNLRWHDWTRRSSRQNEKMQMGGLLGVFELAHRNIEPLLPYLWLGQWTHLGKGCTMGLGRYVIEPIDSEILRENVSKSRCTPRRL